MNNVPLGNNSFLGTKIFNFDSSAIEIETILKTEISYVSVERIDSILTDLTVVREFLILSYPVLTIGDNNENDSSNSNNNNNNNDSIVTSSDGAAAPYTDEISRYYSIMNVIKAIETVDHYKDVIDQLRSIHLKITVPVFFVKNQSNCNSFGPASPSTECSANNPIRSESPRRFAQWNLTLSYCCWYFFFVSEVEPFYSLFIFIFYLLFIFYLFLFPIFFQYCTSFFIIC